MKSYYFEFLPYCLYFEIVVTVPNHADSVSVRMKHFHRTVAAIVESVQPSGIGVQTGQIRRVRQFR